MFFITRRVKIFCSRFSDGGNEKQNANVKIKRMKTEFRGQGASTLSLVPMPFTLRFPFPLLLVLLVNSPQNYWVKDYYTDQWEQFVTNRNLTMYQKKFVILEIIVVKKNPHYITLLV